MGRRTMLSTITGDVEDVGTWCGRVSVSGFWCFHLTSPHLSSIGPVLLLLLLTESILIKFPGEIIHRQHINRCCLTVTKTVRAPPSTSSSIREVQCYRGMTGRTTIPTMFYIITINTQLYANSVQARRSLTEEELLCFLAVPQYI